MQYLQTIVAILLLGEIINRLLKDIYKTNEKQKTREGLLKLNWTIPKIENDIGNKLLLRKNILFSYLLGSKNFTMLKQLQNPLTKLSMNSTITAFFIVISVIFLTAVVLKSSLS
jgi:hypothetical protein